MILAEATQFQVFDLSALKRHSQRKCLRGHRERILGCFRIQHAVIVLGLWHLLTHLYEFILFVTARFLMTTCCSVSLHAGNLTVFWTSLSIFSFVATCFLICGAVKKISIFIVPFLPSQYFDICSWLVFSIAYICEGDSPISTDEFFSRLKPSWFHFQSWFQWYQVSSDFHHQRLFVSIFLFVLCTMKAYLIWMVFSYFQLLLHPLNPDNEPPNFLSVTSSNNYLQSSHRLRLKKRCECEMGEKQPNI